MKIEIPDELIGNRNIYIFGDFELVARKMVTKKWEIKTSPCNHCGMCCMNFHDRKGLLPTTKKDGCLNLEERENGTFRCKAHIPISCLVSNVHPDADYCNVRWKEIESD